MEDNSKFILTFYPQNNYVIQYIFCLIFISRMKWKSTLILITILVIGLTLKIQTESNIEMTNTYKLLCSNAKGRVFYRLQKFTAGIQINGDQLKLDNNIAFVNTRLLVRLYAQDQAGSTDDKIISIFVKKNTQDPTNQYIGEKRAFSQQNDNKTKKNLTAQKNVYVQSKNNIKESAGTLKAQNLQINAPSQQHNLQTNESLSLRQKTSPQQSVKIIVKVSLLQNNNIGKNPQNTNFNIKQLASPVGTPQLNILPSLIASSRAKIIKPTVRPQSVQQTKIIDAYTRQLNINKLIANLLDGVKKATANKNAALEQITARDRQYQQSSMNASLANISLTSAQQNYSKLAQKYTSANLEYNKTQQQLTNLSNQMQNIEQNKLAITQNITSAQQQLEQINKNINKTMDNYTTISKNKESNDKNCQNVYNKISIIMESKEIQMDQIVQHRMKLVPARRRLQMDQQIVTDLRRQLQQAEKSANLSKSVVQFYENQEKNMNQTLNDIQQSLKKQQQYLNKCSQSSADLQLELDNILQQQIPNLNNSKIQAQHNLYQYADQLSTSNIKLTQIKQQIAYNTQQLKQKKKEIFDISFQLSSAQSVLFQKKNIYQDAYDKMNRDKANLQAVGLKYMTEYKKMLELTKQLENARSQKQVIDQQLNNQLRSSANVNTYSIYNQQPIKQDQKVPNVTNSDKVLPPTMNQIGKTEQAIKSQNQAATLLYSGGLSNLVPNLDGSYSIKTMTEFILSFFGPTITLPPALSVNILYPIKPQIQTVINPNSNTQTLQSFIGFVLASKQNSFLLLADSGQVYQIYISQSARILATLALIKIQTGTNAIIRGIMKPDKSIIADLIFCFNK